ncbi:rab GTPase-binding effector protein 1 isoform X2 [Aphidius gifuensis]|uniref:rab GTPase-binding effector protein 1 isoform X2 n=1 Tax=Aphidius gifuensis TaxID=684658 RepID=UPI001CDB9597|nr:rab GTPase-binding effector protein 1 isoform X2 [Aphidius gifuensis]
MDNSDNNHSTIDVIEDEDLQVKIRRLELENMRMREEFDGQRAKLKELFLQKEEELKKRSKESTEYQNEITKYKNELDEAKSQLVVANIRLENDIDLESRKANEEIASLQQVIQDAMEESVCSRNEQDNEIRKLRNYITQLEEENNQIKLQIAKEIPDSPPMSLSTVTKTLARKVASQLGADALSLGPENLDDSMRKAQEDAEVLRSLVVPLEEEIKALKEKLRSTDDELQKCMEQQQKRLDAVANSESTCDMCINYEAQLVKVQTMAKDLEKQLYESDRQLQSQRDDLIKEVEFRKEMEDKWNEKKDEHKIKVTELTAASQLAHKTLQDLKQQFKQMYQGVSDDLKKLTRERENVQRHLIELQMENEMLIGKHSKHSQQLQNENINMPNNVEELHVNLLKAREDLIIAKVAQEVAQEKQASLKYEINLLREQMIAEKDEKICHLEKKLEIAIKDKQEADTTIAELKQRVTSLQQVLDTSGEVQMDFVRLSQSLQVQLEKIRESGSEVRWQHEEDVDECPTCQTSFSIAKKKIHCRHCGHIFCQACLAHVVNSGPKQRPSRVCGVCHTLLVPETAPYFSQKPPHIPD